MRSVACQLWTSIRWPSSCVIRRPVRASVGWQLPRASFAAVMLLLLRIRMLLPLMRWSTLISFQPWRRASTVRGPPVSQTTVPTLAIS